MGQRGRFSMRVYVRERESRREDGRAWFRVRMCVCVCVHIHKLPRVCVCVGGRGVGVLWA